MIEDIYASPDNLWEGFDELAEPPADDETAVTPAERKDVDPDEFWASRPWLAHIHDFARARRVGPWAVLGSALARIIAATPPGLVLPPTTGGAASLNLFVGLVGPSGQGKDAAQKVAKIAVDLGDRPFMEAPLGSGEGLSHMFMKPPPKGSPAGTDPEQYNTKAYVRIGEIDTFSALANRQSSTLTGQLRQAAMGEELGFFYVDLAKRMIVPEHLYRLCLVAGIQPARSAILLEDADGGTPQRFVWLPAGDPGAPAVKPAEPYPMVWTPPDFMPAARLTEGRSMFYLMELPDVAIEAMDRARLERLRNTGEALDSHALITRAKVAAGIALAERRIKVTDDDWRQSSVVMVVSDTQRTLCQKALAKIAETANHGKAVAEAERTIVVQDRIDRSKRDRAIRGVERFLARHGGEASRSEARRSLESAQREYFDAALDVLVASGKVIIADVDSASGTASRIRLA